MARLQQGRGAPAQAPRQARVKGRLCVRVAASLHAVASAAASHTPALAGRAGGAPQVVLELARSQILLHPRRAVDVDVLPMRAPELVASGGGAGLPAAWELYMGKVAAYRQQRAAALAAWETEGKQVCARLRVGSRAPKLELAANAAPTMRPRVH